MITWLLAAQLASSNVIGSDAQNFAPTPDGLDFVTVNSSKVLLPGYINFGFFLNYAANTFPAFDEEGEAPTQSLLDTNDTLTSADINFAVGVLPNFQFGLSAPYIISQEVDDSTNLTRLEGSGTSEVRLGAKYHLGELWGWGWAALYSANFNFIDNNPYLGENPGETNNLEIALDRKIKGVNFAINLGHRWRKRGTALEGTGIDPLPNQLITSMAASYFSRRLDGKVVFEIFGSHPLEETTNLSNRQNSSLEALIGAKQALNSKLAIHFGVGSEILQGTSTPDYRLYSGLNYAIGPVFSKPQFKEHRGEGFVEFQLPNLLFEFDKSELIPQSEVILTKVVERMQLFGKIRKVKITGHTDSIGTEAYNKRLSQSRAEAIFTALKSKLNLPETQFEVEAQGELQPIADNGNYQGRQLNRRVEIRVDLK